MDSGRAVLFGSFIALGLISSITCTITCYDSPLFDNSFDYIITADRIPDQLKNCTVKSVGDTCEIEIKWSTNPNKTDLGLVATDSERTLPTEHSVNTNVNLENKNGQYLWTRSLSYTCSTDRCNGLSVVKSLLDAASMSDTLNDLQNLLKIDDPSVARACQFGGNTTELECATGTEPSSCKACAFLATTINNALEFCAYCLTDDIGETFVSHEVDFDLVNRTRMDHWQMACQTPGCNTIPNGQLIRQKSTFDFDFAKFLKSRSTTLSVSNTLSLLSALLVLSVL